MADKDYYSILGLTEEDKKLHGKEFTDKVSKEFRKLSMKWHPDRWVNGTEEEKKKAEEQFKEISEAYSVLSDENQRAQYDNQGASFDPFSGHGFDPFGPGGPFHGFNQGFGGFNFNFGFGGQQQKQGPVPVNGSNVLIDVTITLEEAYSGCNKKVTYQHEKECDHCHGTGSEDGKTHKCPHCNGLGKIARTVRQDANSMEQVIVDCPYCNGTGTEPDKKCSKCGGLGYVTVTETKDIPVPRGVDNGTIMGYSGLGNPGKNGGQTGALNVRFTVKDDPYFIRNGSNITHIEKVPLADALLGCNIEVRTVDGGKLSLKLQELTASGSRFQFQGRGMPTLDRYGRNGPNGDYVVIVVHELPTKLSKKQKDALKQFSKG